LPTPPLGRNQAQEAVDALALHGSQVAAANALGIARGTFQNRLAAASRYGLSGPVEAKEGFRITRISTRTPDGSTVVQVPEAEPHVPPQGLQLKGVSKYVPGDGWYKYGAEGALSDAALAEAVRAAFADYPLTYDTHPLYDTRADLLTVIPLVDWHVGLLAWEEETGGNYDLNIAQDILRRAMTDLVEATPPSAKCVILGLGDLLHFDGYEAKTERSGNVLDTDSRYPKVLRAALQLVKYTIDAALTRHDTVDVRIMQGNHDNRAALAIAIALAEGYEKHPRVTVNDCPSYIWFERYGKVLLGATHGDKAKMADMPLLMAVDRPADWAASTRRRVFTGHIHHERLREIGGVIVESLRSPVAKDAWHSFEGYRAGRSVYAYTFWTDGTRMARHEFEI
jgi:hypothetical protein